MSTARTRLVVGLVAVLATVVATTSFSTVAAEAATLTVGPGGYSTIQSAVNAARNGDTVQVSAGTYREAVSITKYITLRGASRDTTIIRNPGGAEQVLFLVNLPYTPGYKVTITGFSIADGNAPDGHGGAITLYHSDADITGNVFDSNRAGGYGGAIAAVAGSLPVIRGNIFQRNSAYRGGGAVFVGQGSSATVTGNTFTGNSTSGWSFANGGSSGGAIYMETNAGSKIYPAILNNTFSGNAATFAGGAVMLRTGANAVVEGNTITGNSAPYGAGIHAETTGSRVEIRSNTITGNTSAERDGYGGYGGGIAIFDKTAATIVDNTLTSNRASHGGGGLSIAENSSATVDSNTFSEDGVGAAGQTSQADGGAIYLAQASAGIVNNVFSGGDANQGSAIGVLDSGTASIVNNTIVGNSSRYSPGGAVFFVRGAGLSYLTNNILSQNTNYQIHEEVVHAVKRNNLIDPSSSTGAYSGPNGRKATAADLNAIGGAASAADNFSGDPAFTDRSSDDYTLTSGSPAIGRSTTTDAPGYPRDDRRDVVRAAATIDVGAYSYESAPVAKTSIYRFWSSTKHSHFYTSSRSERDSVASGYLPAEWRYEGVAYGAFSSQVTGSVPLYRFYSATFGGHFYTAVQSERDAVDRNYPDDVWKYEGIAYYVYPLTYSGDAQSVYRFWSPDNRHHFYTASEQERDAVRSSYPAHVWTYEGPNFKVPR